MLPLHEGLVLIDPAVSLALAGVLLALRFNDQANRAFATYLVLESVRVVCVVLGRVVADPRMALVWERLVPYFAIASFFALLHFVTVFPHRRAWLPARVPAFAPYLVLAAALVALYILDPVSIDDPTTPLGAWVHLARAAHWIVPIVLAFDWSREPASPRARTALWLALGLSVGGAYFWTVGNVQLLLRGEPWTWGFALRLLQTAAALAVAAYVGALAVRRRAPEVRRPAARFMLVMALAVATGALVPVASMLVGPGSQADRVVRAAGLAAWTLVLPIVVTYSLLRLQLFDIDLRLKRTVRHGTVAAAFLGTYALVTAGAQLWAPGAAPYVGAGAALLLVAAIVPLQRLADRVAEAAVPGATTGPGALAARLDVYRAALEQAVGEPRRPETAGVLAALRRELGISDRDHAVMEHTLRRAGQAPRPRDAFRGGEILLGRYRVLEPLGQGAFGETYLALDETLRRRVVLKLLRAAEGAEDVLKEARAAAALRHPNVVTIYDVERIGDEALLVMEHAEGGTLARRLREGKLEPAAFAALARDVLAGLEAVHAAGIVHHDVKPSNVLLAADGTAKLGDFGIARVRPPDATIGLSTNGPAVGTPQYMSPEQARGRRCTPRSDLFSAAATLFEAWAGEPYLRVLPDESAVELQMRAAAHGAFRRDVRPAELRDWFARALHPEAGRRFPDARAMRAALPAESLLIPERSSGASGPPR